MTTETGDRTPALAEVLQQLADLAAPASVPQVSELQRRWREQRFRMLVIGEGKRGKSTLINALLGRDVLPVGAVPVTAVTTTITFGRPERVVVEKPDGLAEEHPLASLAGWVTDDGNPKNQRGVERVTVLLDEVLLCDGLELVDTPGAGSVRDHDTETERALQSMDAAVFVLTADPPVSVSERDLLVTVSHAAVRTFIVLNKVDRLDAAELKQVESFVTQVVSAALGDTTRVFCCSAREALRARLAGTEPAGTGLTEFETEFRRYLRTGQAESLQRSLSGRARLLALQALDGVRLRSRLQSMQTDEAAARIAKFQHHLDRVRVRRREAADLAADGIAHLQDDLNVAAASAGQTLAAQVVQLSRRHFDSQLTAMPGADLRREGRPFIADTTRNVVDAWRSTQLAILEAGLRELDLRLVTALAEELAELREATRDFFGFELVAEDDRSRLVEDLNFYYQLSEAVGWTDPLTSVLRHRLPVPAARRKAINDLLTEAARLTSQQVGRVRADFQYRLQESGRTLAREVGDRYGASTRAIEEALSEAARTHGWTGEEADAISAGLLACETRLLRVLGDLERLNPPPEVTAVASPHRRPGR